MAFTPTYKQCRFNLRLQGLMSWVLPACFLFKNKKAQSGNSGHNTIINLF